MRTTFLIVCCLALGLLYAPLCVTPALAAQDTLPPSGWKAAGPKGQVEQSLNLMVQGDIDQAFKTLFGSGGAKDTFDKLKFELYSLTKKSGNPYAYEQLLEQKSGTHLLRYRYLLMYNRVPVIFDFYYYKNPKGWFLRTISYTKDVKKVFTP